MVLWRISRTDLYRGCALIASGRVRNIVAARDARRLQVIIG